MARVNNPNWKPRTRAVHGGTKRSQYGEVSEAIFLTKGFVYDSAEAAEARFVETGPDEYIYARYGNPTVAMFEERIAGLEGPKPPSPLPAAWRRSMAHWFRCCVRAIMLSRRARSSAHAFIF